MFMPTKISVIQKSLALLLKIFFFLTQVFVM